MKQEYYQVFFERRSRVEVYAQCIRDAVILAMAQRIQAGLDYNVRYVEARDGIHDYELECPLCGYAGQ